MQRSILRSAIPALVVLVLGGAAARADVISPDEDTCRTKSVGAACNYDNKSGHCENSTCGRLDYSQGTPPTSKEEPCLRCVPGPAAKSSSKGCAVDGGQGAAGGALLGLGLLALARRRRR